MTKRKIKSVSCFFILIVFILCMAISITFFNPSKANDHTYTSVPMKTSCWLYPFPQVESTSKTYSEAQYAKTNMKFEKSNKTAVVLVNFADKSISTSHSEWENLIFSNESNSVNNYYRNISQGQWTVAPVCETSKTPNDGIIEVQLDTYHPNNKKVLNDNLYSAVHQSIQHASNYIDLSEIDTNNNETIESNELIWIVVFAGYEESYSEGIMPSSSGFCHEISQFGKIGNYVMTEFIQIGELYYNKNDSDHNSITTPGIIVHELGHILGLPDLYDTKYTSQGVGLFSLMGYGDKLFRLGGKLGDSPVDLDPWSKIYLGFIDPQIITVSGNYTIRSNKYGNPDIFVISTKRKGEYFIVENRSLEGYDSPLNMYVKPGGILIWHIDENQIFNHINTNTVNDNPNYKGVDLEESSEAILGYSQLDTNEKFTIYKPFYLSTGNAKFNPESKPSSNLNDNTPSRISIEIIEDGINSKVKIEFSKLN